MANEWSLNERAHTHTHCQKEHMLNTIFIRFNSKYTHSEWWKWLGMVKMTSTSSIQIPWIFQEKKNKHLIASSLFLFSSIRLKSGIVIIYLPLAETISMAQVHHETFKMASLFWLLLWISLWFNLMNFPPHNYKNPALARENNSLGMQHTHTKLAHSKKKRQKQT